MTIIVAATHSGVGKTTITCALIKALQNKGLKVASFKNGPDYIDPTYHAHVSGQPCRNLDSWMMPKKNLIKTFNKNIGDSDLAVIEGSMGLFDGQGSTEAGSSAHLAKILQADVLLIVDASSMSSSCAALIHGFKNFDKEVNISGIILNKVGSVRHLDILQNAVKKSGVPLVGWLPKDDNITIKKRHLGLHMAGEIKELDEKINKITAQIEQNFDLNIFHPPLSPLPSREERLTPSPLAGEGRGEGESVRIGIAKDAAFNFYYQDNLDLLKEAGAELIFFSPLKDKKLPSVDGLYFGGGYPELYAEKLAANTSLKKEVKETIESNMPVYAECGGFLYLSKSLTNKTGTHKMVNAFSSTSKMQPKFQALGYTEASTLNSNILAKENTNLRGHQFHYSETSYPQNNSYAYFLDNSQKSGCVYRNTLASYLHLHFASDFNLAKNLVNSCKKYYKEHH